MTKKEREHIASHIGGAIAKRRVGCQMTQEEVAERLGIGNEAVSRIERGRVIPNVIRLVQLSAIFNCETAELLGEVSLQTDDQASRMKDMLAPLEQQDRKLILDITESLAARLHQKAPNEK
ncbi:helix-turn-helix transcriptional regulator [Halomonas sp. PAMB 3264]|uniref:helix-turn-helix domain-containing protein n=1 Tax=Halomonas sp. PAMB 3264 TaxID=3075222 RepID=UPI002898D88B|nr:helix-turn-helix transcriptional regulator [Halomonas sp. PAMB 3264]WNL42945.1 helix-turn-helix transcriptional regulator [Halomonas sp. PAMB 3264]